MRWCRFLLLGVLVGCVGVGTVGGCGGGGGKGKGGSGGQILTARGIVQLPPGSSLALADLKVATALGDAPVAPDGRFTARVLSQGPSLVSLQEASGKILMLGYVNAATAEQGEISPKQTAKALLSMALGAFTLPSEHHRKALELIEQNPVLQQLEQTVSARLAASPAALQEGDPEILAALRQARDALLPASAGGGRAASAPRLTSAAVTVARRNEPEGHHPVSRSGRQGEQAGLLIEPSGIQQSGVEVVQNPDGRGIVLVNHFRRHSRFLIYQTGFEDENGNRTNFETARQVGDLRDLPATKRLEVFSALTDAIKAAPSLFDPNAQIQSALTPVSSEPVDLPAEPGAVKTFFEVIVLGPGRLGRLESLPLFQDPRYAPFVQRWKAESTALATLNFVESFLLPLFEHLAIGGAAQYSNDQVRRMVDALNQSVADLPVHLQDFNVRQAMQRLQQAMAGDIAGAQFLFSHEQILAERLEAEQRIEAAEELRRSQGKVAKQLQALARAGAIIAAVNLALGGLDLGAVLADTGKSREADVWAVTAFARERVVPIAIEPDCAVITAPDATVTFRATTGTDQPVILRWSRSGGLVGTLSGSPGSLETRQRTVTFEPTVRSIVNNMLASVTVEVFPDNGGPIPADAKPIGRAEAFVVTQAPVNCASPDLSKFDDDDGFITMSAPGSAVAGGTFTVTVTVNRGNGAHVVCKMADPNKVVVDGVLQPRAGTTSILGCGGSTSPSNPGFVLEGATATVDGRGSHTVTFTIIKCAQDDCPRDVGDGCFAGPWVSASNFPLNQETRSVSIPFTISGSRHNH